MLWDKKAEVNVRINLPESITITRLNNAAVSKIDSKSAIIEGFEENGFLGIIFKSNIVAESAVDRLIEIEVTVAKNTPQKYTASVHLFRPRIEISDIPHYITLSNNEIDPKNKIKVINHGEGLALLLFEAELDSEIKIGLPEGLNQFREHFLEDLFKEFIELKNKYPFSTNVLDELEELGKKTRLDKEYPAKIEKIGNEINQLSKENQNFGEDFYDAYSLSLVKNLPYFNRLESLHEYFKEAATEKALIINSPNMLEINEGVTTFKGTLYVMDMAFFQYPETKLNFKISSSTKTRFPVYKLFASNKK